MQTSAKEPWLAVWLSSIYAGVGQIYSGNRKKGILFIAIVTILSLVTLAAIVWFALEPSAVKVILLIIFGIGAFVFRIYNLFDAYITAKNENQASHLQPTPRIKQPFLALFLSTIVLGLGQIYNSRWLKGIGFFIGLPSLDAF